MTLPQVETSLLPLPESGPRVVAIGGGHGLSQLLQAVRSYAGEITAVVSVADDGGSSGRLIAGLDMPPPGDVRRALLALAADATIARALFGYRFEGADVAGHSLGNLLLAALTDITGDFTRALDVAGEMLGAVGRVLPAALHGLRIEAIVDGERVRGQVAVATAEGCIERLDLVPTDGDPHPEVIEAIRGADQVVLAPGSLYTSLIAALRAPGVATAVNEADGEIVWVMNLVTQHRETLGMSGPDHLRALQEVGGISRPGTILLHDGPLVVPGIVERVELDVIDAVEWGWLAMATDLADRTAAWPQHDPIRLGTALVGLTRS